MRYPGDFDRVALDQAGRAGDVGQGEGGEEREREGEEEHGQECTRLDRQ